MTDTIALPAGFEELAGLAARWARPTEGQRNAIRWTSSKADFADFYTRFIPHLDAALERLEKVPLDGLEEGPDANLFHLVAAFAEASPHHELYGGSAEVPFSFAARRFQPGHADLPSVSVEFR